MMVGSNSISNIATHPTAVALLTITSAVAITLTIQRSKKVMSGPPNKRAAAAAAGASGSQERDAPNLPNPNYVASSFQNSRGQSLFTINLPPKDISSPPKAMLFLVHGVAEHCCRDGYLGLHESLSETGVDVYSMDHHGHGRSEGHPRGYVEKFDDYVTDLWDYIQLSKKKYTDRGATCPPLVLMGQSMGALISILAALSLGSYHVGGLILTSPALGVDMKLELKVQKFFAPMINKLMPKANIVDAVRPEDMSRNAKAVKAYINDPLVMKGKLVARTAIEMSKAFDIVKERRGEITCPVLMLHGTNDRCTSINASKDFFESIGTALSKKRFLQLEGVYHEILEDPEADKLMIGIVGFATSGGSQFSGIEEEEGDGVVVIDCK